MKTSLAVTSAASLFAVAFALVSLAGCAVDPATETETETTNETATNDDGNVGIVEQRLGPNEPCSQLIGGCDGTSGQNEGPPEHHNKGIVKVCATQRTACYKKCKGTNPQIIECQKKCSTAHKECLEDY